MFSMVMEVFGKEKNGLKKKKKFGIRNRRNTWREMISKWFIKILKFPFKKKKWMKFDLISFNLFIHINNFYLVKSGISCQYIVSLSFWFLKLLVDSYKNSK